MPGTPGKFRGPTHRPSSAGKPKTQTPNPLGDSKKQGKLLRDLDRLKLEGDPLTLYGNSTEITTDQGDIPTTPGESLSEGYRIVLYGGRTDAPKTAIGVHDGGSVWIQVPSNLGEDVPVFDIYKGPSSSASVTSIFRIVHRSINTGTLWPYLLVGEDDGGTILPTSPLHVRGPISVDLAEVSAGQDFEQFWGFYIADATAASFTLTLDDPGIVQGRIYMVKRINGGANTVAIDVDGGGTIDGAASKTLSSQYAAVGLIAGPDEWHLLWTMGTVV